MKTLIWPALAVAIVAGFTTSLTSGQVDICNGASGPACQAVRGDRSEGWLPQTRSEVMARNGMVTTVQPLAAQVGLRILQQGGNAIDAAVASAAALNVMYPANTGIGGDLFALIYVAKEKKVYQLNASGIAPAGLTLARMQSLGYKAIPRTLARVPACRQEAFSPSPCRDRSGAGRKCSRGSERKHSKRCCSRPSTMRSRDFRSAKKSPAAGA